MYLYYTVYVPNTVNCTQYRQMTYSRSGEVICAPVYHKGYAGIAQRTVSVKFMNGTLFSIIHSFFEYDCEIVWKCQLDLWIQRELRSRINQDLLSTQTSTDLRTYFVEPETWSIIWFPATQEQKSLQNYNWSQINRGEQKTSRQVDKHYEISHFPQRLVNLNFRVLRLIQPR